MRDEDHPDVEIGFQTLDQIQDLGLHRHVESRGRLVCDQHIRVVNEGHRDHGPLSHTSRELMRVIVVARVRARDANGSQEVDNAFLRSLLAAVLVREDRLCDLIAYLVQRMQTRERVLEDHRELLAANLAQLLVGDLQQIAPLEDHLAGHVRGLEVRQTKASETRDALAGARFAHDPQRLAAIEFEGDAIHGLDDPVGGIEVNLEVLDLE